MSKQIIDQRELTMSVLMTPDMANFSGNVHGGVLLRLLDEVAYACASRYAGCYVVTLLVDPQEAEALTLANNEGHIQLLLRNSTDDKRAATQGRQLHDLYGTTAKKEPEPVAAAAPRAARKTAPPPPAAGQARTPAPPTLEVDQVIVMHGATRKVEVFAK